MCGYTLLSKESYTKVYEHKEVALKLFNFNLAWLFTGFHLSCFRQCNAGCATDWLTGWQLAW